METRTINWLMPLLSLLGGIIGAVLGELLVKQLEFDIPDYVLVGLYFGIVALFIAIGCFAAEFFHPAINGYTWRAQYAVVSLKYLILTSLIMAFIVSTLLQFIYGLNIFGNKKIKDVLMIIDTSGSMSENDPTNDRFIATANLIDELDEDKRVGVITFNDSQVLVQPLSDMTESLKESLKEKLESYKEPSGGTDIASVLKYGAEHLKENTREDCKSMVIFLTDGLDSNDINGNLTSIVNPYKEMEVPVYTVGLGNEDYNVLKSISKETQGSYFNIDEADKLERIFNKIYNLREQRLLMDRRNGVFENSAFYGAVRILFVTIIGLTIGLGLGLMFDNKSLAKSLVIGGILSGFISGIALEVGFNINGIQSFSLRLIAIGVLSAVMPLVPVKLTLK